MRVNRDVRVDCREPRREPLRLGPADVILGVQLALEVAALYDVAVDEKEIDARAGKKLRGHAAQGAEADDDRGAAFQLPLAARADENLLPHVALHGRREGLGLLKVAEGCL